jgi:thiol:disulfide interchange protein DsbC
LSVLMAISGVCSMAQAEAVDKNVTVISDTIAKRLPKLQIEKVQASAWKGIYEVYTQNELIYSDATGDHLFIGKVMDTNTRHDLTSKRWNESLNVDFSSLPFDKAIKIVKGSGKRQLAVFADPHCPYCVKLEEVLEQLTDLTVYVFLFPLEGLHPEARVAARQIWCSENRGVAWLDWMRRNKQPADATCEGVPTSELQTLGIKLKINSTPTLYFADGHRVSGALEKEELEKLFTDHVAKK